MKSKNILVTVAIVIVSFALGVGGTLYAQKSGWLEIFTKVAKEVNKTDGPLVSIGEFTLNLQGESYLKTSITLEGADAKSEPILKEKEPMLKDAVVSVLTNKSLDEVKSPQAREKLRQELLKELNKIADEQVQNLFFVSFVYQ